jgi:hypothetical protein
LPGRGLALLALIAGCDDPLQPRPAPEVAALAVFMVLDPDRSTQAMVLQEPPGLGLRDLRAVVELAGSGAHVADITSPAPASGEAHSREIQPCIERYGVGEFNWQLRCIEMSLAPGFGTRYAVSISAPGRPTARAVTTVPENFAVVSRSVDGAPPGTVGIHLEWTRSAGTYRYVIAIRGNADFMGARHCFPDSSCHDRWFAVTEDTTLSAAVDAKHFTESEPPYFIDVYAMNRDVYDHLMTGVTSDFFPVAPAQNVTGGHGAIGAWVKRSVPIP